jgi:ribose transport system substrate-binding protein
MSTQQRKFLWQTAARGAALLFAGAAVFSTVAVSAADKPPRVTLLLAYTIGEWNTELKSGAEAAIKDLGFPVDLRLAGPSSFNPPQQAAIFQNEAQTHPDAIVITDVAPPLFIQPVLDAEKSGIKIAWINSAPASDFYKGFFVSVDPTAVGRTAADIVAKTLEKKLGKPANEISGTVLVGLCVPGLAILENRIAGTRLGLAEKMPKVKVLPTIQTRPDREGNFVSWNEAIRKNPDALAYLDACEEGQRNIAKIIKDDKLNATSVAYDAPEETREAIKNKVIPASTPASFFVQAYLGVYYAAKSIHDSTPLPSGWLKIAPVVVDSSNIDSFIAGWADPAPGLRKFYGPQIDAAKADAAAGKFAPIAEYDKPKQ